jgi:hypothetical protein
MCNVHSNAHSNTLVERVDSIVFNSYSIVQTITKHEQ